MIRPDQIPDEVVEAFVEAFHGQDMTRAAAIAAALNAWPGMHFIGNIGVHLPLPTGDGQ
jgi:hypothetical protein